MSVDFIAIGRHIKARRKRAGLTQDRMAELLSVSVGYVSQLERGVTKVNLEMLNRVAELLKCEMADLIGGSESQKADYLCDELFEVYAALTPENKKRLLSIAKALREE